MSNNNIVIHSTHQHIIKSRDQRNKHFMNNAQNQILYIMHTCIGHYITTTHLHFHTCHRDREQSKKKAENEWQREYKTSCC